MHLSKMAVVALQRSDWAVAARSALSRLATVIPQPRNRVTKCCLLHCSADRASSLAPLVRAGACVGASIHVLCGVLITSNRWREALICDEKG